MATSFMSVMKMDNTVPGVGLKPTSLAFRGNVLPLHHIGSLLSPLAHLASEVSTEYYTIFSSSIKDFIYQDG